MADALQLPDGEKPLTDKQEAFVAYYIGQAAFNATEAARLAGYSDAMQAGYENKMKPYVRARIDAYLDALSMTGAEALAECAAVARAPTSHYQQVINEYTDKSGTHVQIVRQDYSSKVKALELILKARGMLREQVDINVRETRTIVGVNISDVTGRTINSTASEQEEE